MARGVSGPGGGMPGPAAGGRQDIGPDGPRRNHNGPDGPNGPNGPKTSRLDNAMKWGGRGLDAAGMVADLVGVIGQAKQALQGFSGGAPQGGGGPCGVGQAGGPSSVFAGQQSCGPKGLMQMLGPIMDILQMMMKMIAKEAADGCKPGMPGMPGFGKPPGAGIPSMPSMPGMPGMMPGMPPMPGIGMPGAGMPGMGMPGGGMGNPMFPTTPPGMNWLQNVNNLVGGLNNLAYTGSPGGMPGMGGGMPGMGMPGGGMPGMGMPGMGMPGMGAAPALGNAATMFAQGASQFANGAAGLMQMLGGKASAMGAGAQMAAGSMPQGVMQAGQAAAQNVGNLISPNGVQGTFERKVNNFNQLSSNFDQLKRPDGFVHTQDLRMIGAGGTPEHMRNGPPISDGLRAAARDYALNPNAMMNLETAQARIQGGTPGQLAPDGRIGKGDIQATAQGIQPLATAQGMFVFNPR